MSLTIEDVRRIGDPLAAQMLPGWTVIWSVVKPEAIGGNLAMACSTPNRQIVSIKVAPHPPNESIEATIAHELTHAALSPLTHLIEYSDAARTIEEQIVERLGNMLAKLSKSSPIMARSIIGAFKNPRTCSNIIRARVSTFATRYNSRGTSMDIKMFLAALKAALTAEDPKAAIESLVSEVEAMGSGEPDGDEAPAVGKDAQPQDKPGDSAGAEAMAYRGKAQNLRAREAASEIELIARDERQLAKERIVARLREALPEDHSGLPAIEKKIMAARDYQSAKDMAELVIAAGGGQSRANSGAKAGSVKERANAAPVGASDEELKKLGCDAAWIANYRSELAKDPKGAEALLDGIRYRNATGNNPWSKGGDA